MIDFFMNLNPFFQSFLACSFTFFLTSLGSSTIFFVDYFNHKYLQLFLSISAGIMLASTIFSLLVPAIQFFPIFNFFNLIVISSGIFLGTLMLFFCDLYDSFNTNDTYIKKLIMSMTIHNFPEGMAIGVAFASACNGDNISLMSAISLAIGIGIQNFPEGSAISFPLYNSGYSKIKSFIIASLTAAVEPLGGLLGTFIAIKFPIMLPFLLSLASGSMFYVIITELIPEIMQNKNKELMALYLMIGFIIMMILDISIG